MTAVLGHGMPANPAHAVRGTSLSTRDPLAQEWAVVVIAAHFSAAPSPDDHGATPPPAATCGWHGSRERPYDVAVTY